MVYQDVTRNKNISASAKGLYAYLSSFCGMGDECYPSVDTITKEMGMGKDTFYRHINALVAAGVVEKRQTEGEGGKFGRTVYRLTHMVAISDFPITQNEDTDRPEPVPGETKNNNIKNNNTKNNNTYSVHFEEIWSAYPRKKEKARAYKCYKARLEDGYSEEQLLDAVKRYAEECKRLKTEERYIKHLGTFFGPSTPFTDYLERKVGEHEESGNNEAGESSLKLW